MDTNKILSYLRYGAMAIQGNTLKQVLHRSAKEEAKKRAKSSEVFTELQKNIKKHLKDLPLEEFFTIMTDADKLKQLKETLFNNLVEKYQWEETKQSLMEGVSPDNNYVSKLIDNTYNLIQSEKEYYLKTQNFDGLSRLLPAIVRRVYGSFDIDKIIGIQPMTGPVGLAYVLRSVGSKDKVINLEVVKTPVQAATKKLQAGWTIEVMQDFNTQHGLDLESEMIDILSAEIYNEIVAAIIHDLTMLAGFEKDVLLFESGTKGVISSIDKMVNNIGAATKRGGGNWVIVPDSIANLLKKDLEQNEKESKFVPIEHSKHKIFKLIGILFGSVRVYNFKPLSDKILVGYKGGNGEIDTGYVHLPYMPCMSSGVVINPETFEPVVTLMTRAGRYTDEESKNYYGLINIKE